MHPTLLSTLAALCVLPPILASPYPFHSFRGQSLTRSYGRGPQPSRVHLSSYPTATSTPVSYCPPQPAPERYQREIFDAFVQQLYVEKDVFGAFDKFIAVDLIEHDPFDAQGRAPKAAKLSNIIPFVPTTVLRTNFNHDIGLIHVRVDQPGEQPIALADIYRMNGTCIVEHWDVTQARPVNATNPIAMF